ncbi:DUF6894 family protein [Methylobacterium oxalidis]|uniref:DUF6894 domain-containing protein n=1 Tax=Methylobacterium oxalidis TaxID=944322 RepID=A0A512JDH3_9HYPH|nr:hypothetical protein [Methylobacterium oxalidis]GEP07968.1 hypothetical protein MOX02_60060 [Methylobacterium oxalidis]GJE35633.1 hypothetical protein LDDCCGHA_5853 [Methylobacterium oxalidis]GLS64644.1 hypothetical protein GCM10007888_30250 [Methylobacterium oxalidis]
MPRHFFDVHIDRKVTRDDTGTEFATLEEVRKAAQRLLPDVAHDEIPEDGDRQAELLEGPLRSIGLDQLYVWDGRKCEGPFLGQEP